MKKKIADRWVKALRSGEFPQGKFRLNEEGRYCCLCVLCELALADGKAKKFSNVDRSGLKIYGYSGDESYPEYTNLDTALMAWSGLKTGNGSLFTRKDGNISLANMNDIFGNSFEQIADFIEKNYKKL